MGAAQRLWIEQSRDPGGILGLTRVDGTADEGESSVEQALFIWKDSAAEFADCLIGMRHLEVGYQATASCDQQALKLPGFIAG